VPLEACTPSSAAVVEFRYHKAMNDRVFCPFAREGDSLRIEKRCDDSQKADDLGSTTRVTMKKAEKRQKTMLVLRLRIRPTTK
jgi:hypothetical protein